MNSTWSSDVDTTSNNYWSDDNGNSVTTHDQPTDKQKDLSEQVTAILNIYIYYNFLQV